MTTSGNSKGICLGEKTRWVIKGLSDYERFFRHLACLVPQSGAVIYVEGTSISPDVREFLENHCAPATQKVQRGTIWPKPSISEIADHCHVYTKDGMILQWYDACDKGCPLGAGPTIPEEDVKAFCNATGASYTEHKNG